MSEIQDVIIIGGGAAGMIAAVSAAENGAKTLLAEKNDRLGRKLAITGKGRCNITNNCSLDEVLKNIPRNPRFLYGAVSRFSPYDTMEFFEGLGVPLKTERGNRVFPVSDKAADVVNALTKRLEELNVTILTEKVTGLILENGACVGVNTQNRQIRAKTTILATGGASYPKTGSDGFGYRLARSAGHSVTEIRPSLSALTTEFSPLFRAAGLTLKNAEITLKCDNKAIYKDFGELMFTADGIGGATVLSASAHIPENSAERCTLQIDLKPALSEQKLDARILRDFAELHGKTFADSLRKLLPRELVEPFCEITDISGEKSLGEITKIERKSLVKTLKNIELKIRGFRPIAEAIITRGGVPVSEISPKTMASRLCERLYLAGEIIDVDGYTGGFNLQIAFSTGRLAGQSAAEYVKSSRKFS